LTDTGDDRLEAMHLAGIDRAVLSNVGSVQLVRETSVALRLAREANDYMAEVVRKRPEHYDGFATIALQDPVAGADELERAVRELGLKGAMLFGPSRGEYLDADCFSPFWERAAHLGVPIYFHAASPVTMPENFIGREELQGAVWGWTVETATHFLRLVFSGVFSRYPAARVVLGHMGETLPYLSSRLDARGLGMGWVTGALPSDIMRSNLLITTSGVFADAPLRCAIDTLGIDNVMFSLDYPFESGVEAREWFINARVSEAESLAIARGNAQAVLNLS
jgi:2,3-dihydroxybenzoate decarboxylase